MHQRNVLRVCLLLILSMVLIACNAVESTPTLKPDSTPAGVDIAAITLEQTEAVTNLTGDTLTVSFPADWLKGDNTDTILLANDAGLLDGSVGAPTGGQAGVSILAFRLAFAQTLAGDEPLTPETLVTSFAGDAAEADSTTFSDTEAFMLDGKAAARAAGTDDQSDGLILIVELDNAYVMLVGATAKGELAQFEPIMQAILNSVAFELADEAGAAGIENMAEVTPEMTVESTPEPVAE